MRAVKSSSDERNGIGKYLMASLYATLFSLAVLIILSAILSFISLKAMMNPGVESLLCYIVYGLSGAFCGFLSASQVNRLGIAAAVMSGVMMSLVLYFGGLLLDGHSASFSVVLKMMGILTGASAVGGILRMYTKR